MTTYDILRIMYPKTYFTPPAVLHYIEKQQRKKFLPRLETVIGNPPFTVDFS